MRKEGEQKKINKGVKVKSLWCLSGGHCPRDTATDETRSRPAMETVDWGERKESLPHGLCPHRMASAIQFNAVENIETLQKKKRK